MSNLNYKTYKCSNNVRFIFNSGGYQINLKLMIKTSNKFLRRLMWAMLHDLFAAHKKINSLRSGKKHSISIATV